MKDDFVIMGFHFHIARLESNLKGKKCHVSQMVNDPQQAICLAWERLLLQSDSWSIIGFCAAAVLTPPLALHGAQWTPYGRKKPKPFITCVSDFPEASQQRGTYRCLPDVALSCGRGMPSPSVLRFLLVKLELMYSFPSPFPFFIQ